MKIVTTPTVKPIPTEEPYSTVELELFPRGVTRETYKQAEGKPAPAFDFNLPVKRWADTTADPTRPYAMLVLDRKNLLLVWRSIPGVQAVAFNLPGAYEYPSWQPAASGVRILNVKTGQTTQGATAELLSTREQAEALAAELAVLVGVAPSVEETTINEDFQYIYPSNEARRVYRLRFLLKGRPYLFNVGLLLKEKYRAGVGAPGKWQVVTIGDGSWNLSWGSQVGPTTDWNDIPETPIPLRELHAHEELFPQFGGNIGVRTKKTAPAPAGGGGFTEEDRSLLRSIAARLKDVGDKLGQILGV